MAQKRVLTEETLKAFTYKYLIITLRKQWQNFPLGFVVTNFTSSFFKLCMYPLLQKLVFEKKNNFRFTNLLLNKTQMILGFFTILFYRWNLKISSWNVDGVRACAKKGGAALLEHEQPDVLCLQETKVSTKLHTFSSIQIRFSMFIKL